MESITIRRAADDDIDALFDFLYLHGVNEWNHLPPGPIRAHLDGIATERTFAVIAEQDSQLIGFVSFELGHDFERYQPAGREKKLHAIVHEAVVHGDFAGRGIGSQLLIAAVARAAELGCQEVYVGRHDENLASGGMMRKAGFEVLDVYDDPRRTSGNKRTAISRRIVG